jgi:hypothetical protein
MYSYTFKLNAILIRGIKFDYKVNIVADDEMLARLMLRMLVDRTYDCVVKVELIEKTKLATKDEVIGDIRLTEHKLE